MNGSESGAASAVNFERNEESVPDLTGKVHQLPCCIKYSSPTSVSQYFRPKSTGVEIDGLNVEEAFFRGRSLQGAVIYFPEGYSVKQRYEELRKELKLVDPENKALDRQRRKERRMKAKMKKRGREEVEDSEMESDDDNSGTEEESGTAANGEKEEGRKNPTSISARSWVQDDDPLPLVLILWNSVGQKCLGLETKDLFWERKIQLKMLKTQEKTNTWGTEAKFRNMTIWNHDSLPSHDDAFMRAFHWFAVAKSLHRPASTEDLKSMTLCQKQE